MRDSELKFDNIQNGIDMKLYMFRQEVSELTFVSHPPYWYLSLSISWFNVLSPTVGLFAFQYVIACAAKS